MGTNLAVSFKKIGQPNDALLELLLLADPSETKTDTTEIMNLAVKFNVVSALLASILIFSDEIIPSVSTKMALSAEI